MEEKTSLPMAVLDKTRPSNGDPAKQEKDSFFSKEPPPQFRNQLRQLLHGIKAVRLGDFSVRFPVSEGIVGDLGEVLNDIIELNDNLAKELVRVNKSVGQEGRMTERASIGPVRGSWATGVESVNALIGDLVQPTNEVARVIASVAK